jgi:CHAT domain
MSLASDATSYAIEKGELEKAVELLEQGRVLLWSETRGFRTPLDRLRQVDETLADRFASTSRALANLTLSSELQFNPLALNDKERMGPGFSVWMDLRLKTQRRLWGELDDLVKQIRTMDGFEDFLQVVPFSALQTAAAEGPVVIVNHNKYHSDALILLKTGRPLVVPLGDIYEDVSCMSSEFSLARSSRASDAKRFRLSLQSVLRTLWKLIVCPVVEQLRAIGLAEKSRIWWCPTSVLSGLPIHAAGPYSSDQMNLPDLYISSYTPTLSALIAARVGIAPTSQQPKLLVVGRPGLTLPMVEAEVRVVEELGDFVTSLVGQAATRDAVANGLKDHPWVHFADHGHLLPRQPFDSSHDNVRLTLLDLIQSHLPNAEFAFLSACHSAECSDDGTPNEVLRLAAAMQCCGFRSVIGTLWAVADTDGHQLSKDFYEYVLSKDSDREQEVGFRKSGRALYEATKKMRKEKGITLERWVNFVHIGA